MYCKNCGNQIDDNAVVCVHCGCSVKDAPDKSSDEVNLLAILGFAAAFISSIAGLILSIMGYKNADARYGGKQKGFALAGIIVSAVRAALAVIAVSLYILFIFAIVGTVPYAA